MKAHFIIVGQGLAGSLLAFELLQLGKSVVVFDDPSRLNASNVAAGLINPFGFKRMNKSWLADDVFLQMELTYRQLENLLGESFYFPASIHRILKENEANFWNEKRTGNHLEDFIGQAPEQNFSHPQLISPFGTGEVKKAGRLELKKLIYTFSGYLGKQGLLKKERLQLSKLELGTEKVIYKNIVADKIIFCEGQAAAQNPFFRSLTFKSSKGEVLEVEIPGLDLNDIISREIFIIPVGNNRYRVGSTYRWDQLDTEITDDARQELMGKLKNVILAEPEIREQKAGIRPTMHDRKPVIGLLPDFSQVGIFNGLGPKGVLLGPFFARRFALFLTGQSTLIPSEVSIQRYFMKKMK